MLYDCKLNGRLSSNVDGHVDNYLLMLCSMPLTIIVRLVFNIKKKPAMSMNNMFINTLSSSLSCLLPHRCIHTHIVFILCYVIGHFASIIANIIIYAYFTQFELGFFFFPCYIID